MDKESEIQKLRDERKQLRRELFEAKEKLKQSNANYQRVCTILGRRKRSMANQHAKLSMIKQILRMKTGGRVLGTQLRTLVLERSVKDYRQKVAAGVIREADPIDNGFAPMPPKRREPAHA